MTRFGLISLVLAPVTLLAGCACDCPACRGIDAIESSPVIAPPDAEAEKAAPEPEQAQPPDAPQAAPNDAPDAPIADPPVTDLRIEDLTVGNGPRVTRESIILATMKGRIRGGRTFHESTQPEGPWPVRDLIEGLAAGLEGMAPDGRRRITIPPDLAYGDDPVISEATGQTIIPPGSTLVYEVTLVEIVAGAAPPAQEEPTAEGEQP